jgi:hypothetical protein
VGCTVNQAILKHFYFTQKSTLLNPAVSTVSLKLCRQTRQVQSKPPCHNHPTLTLTLPVCCWSVAGLFPLKSLTINDVTDVAGFSDFTIISCPF